MLNKYKNILTDLQDADLEVKNTRKVVEDLAKILAIASKDHGSLNEITKLTLSALGHANSMMEKAHAKATKIQQELEGVEERLEKVTYH